MTNEETVRDIIDGAIRAGSRISTDDGNLKQDQENDEMRKKFADFAMIQLAPYIKQDESSIEAENDRLENMMFG